MKENSEIKSLAEFHDFILCIVKALEARDPYTSNHSDRVAEMSEGICEWLGVDACLLEQIHIAAHLHDIGKIGVPDAVLLKQGKLNDEEWQEMKKHPVTGADIISGVSQFKDLVALVRGHHERWDGKGYPDGKKGLEIPFGARVIAVADSIDAMMSDRPYRKALTSEVCYAEIKKNVGIMYDPEIAKVVLEHWDDILSRREQDCDLR